MMARCAGIRLDWPCSVFLCVLRLSPGLDITTTSVTMRRVWEAVESVALIIALSHCLHSSHYLSHNYTTDFSVTNKQGSLPHLSAGATVSPACSQLSVAPFRCLKTWLVRRHWGQAAGRRRGQKSKSFLRGMQSSSLIKSFSVDI